MTYLLGPILAMTFFFGKAQTQYDNYYLIQVSPKTKEQLDILHHLQNTRDAYIFWNSIPSLNVPVNIVVAPHLRSEFREIAVYLNLTTKQIANNVQTLINNERELNRKTLPYFNWMIYQTLDNIYNWLKSLEEQYPDKVKLIKGGKTYEKKEILGIKISFKSGNKGVVLEGGIHGREWISPATVTYIANQLLISNDSAVRKVAESRDWYIFPVVNPDSYVYTHTTDRLWRKNRRPHFLSIGVDLARNWGYHWNEDGKYVKPSTAFYGGPSAFSEIETKSLSNFITTIGPTLDSYISFHNFNQMIQIPFGYAGNEVPVNNKELYTIARNAAKALAKRYGTIYTVENYRKMLSASSGGSLDWAMGTFKTIRIGYNFALKGGDNGIELPPKEIIRNGEEIVDSLISIFQQADA